MRTHNQERWSCTQCGSDLWKSEKVLLHDSRYFCSERCLFENLRPGCPHDESRCACCCYECFLESRQRQREMDNSGMKIKDRSVPVYTGKPLWTASEVWGKKKAADPDLGHMLEEEMLKEC